MTLTRMSRNEKSLSPRRQDAKFNLINYLCGFARKFFIRKCKNFIFNHLNRNFLQEIEEYN
jgi:hypothetical protein